MKCSCCGKDNPESLRFCQDCGTKLVAPNAAPLSAPAASVGAGAPPLPAVPGVPALPPLTSGFGGTAILSPARSVPSRSVPPAGSVSERPSQNPARLRPEAPTFEFGPRAVPPHHRVCGRCGQEVPGTCAFCPECGAGLERRSGPLEAAADSVAPPNAPSHRRCTACGAEIGPNMPYCQGCGSRATDNAAPPPSAPTERHTSLPAAPRLIPSEPAAPPTVRNSGELHTPAASSDTESARLVIIGQDGTPGRAFALNSGTTDIGRLEGDVLLGGDPFVCPRHARIVREGGMFGLVDLQSVNGIYVRLRQAVPLLSGDMLLVGLQVLQFEILSGSESGFGPAVERGTALFGTPAGPRCARLVERTVEGVPRNVYVLGREETILGREVGDIVLSSDPFMSRRHAAISQSPQVGTFALRDLGSSNGTFLRVRGRSELEPGDHLRIGQHLFRLDVDNGQATR